MWTAGSSPAALNFSAQRFLAASRDEEAWNFWAEKFRAAGLDPAVHIVNGNKKDNFWMMGETGPCGPCSELHVDLTPDGDTRGALVNKGSAECIEIWNLVFIQFNANPDGSFTPLPARHVDTGMGFERVTSIIQGTKNLTDFASARISNYETDIFRPIFDEIEKLSGKTYGSTLPASGSTGDTEQEKTDVAFRVIADHIRTLSFAIADGIQPGNTDRNYVLRRILRRAVRYGRSLGLHEPFFHKLVDVLARTMGEVFPELRAKQKHIEQVLKLEEETFNRTLDKRIALFNEEVSRITTVPGTAPASGAVFRALAGNRIAFSGPEPRVASVGQLEFCIRGIAANVAELFVKIGFAANQAIIGFRLPHRNAGDIRGFVDSVRGGGFDRLEDVDEGMEDGFAGGRFDFDLRLEKQVHMIGHHAGGVEF
ncbi:MAG: alanine--tRNA ligase-related protein, partial [Spartobacteria bacterium]